jgi:hypothetical protein
MFNFVVSKLAYIVKIMKKLSLLTLCYLLTFAVKAQITITSNDLGSVGEMVMLRPVLDTVIPVGASGANQNWDFSNLLPDFTTLDTVHFEAASATSPNGTNIHIRTQDIILFANKSTTRASVVGLGGGFLNNLPPLPVNIPIPPSINLSPQVSIIKFPATLGSNFNENGNSQRIQFAFDTTLNINGVNVNIDSVRIRLNYRANSNVDAWGNVILPNNMTYSCIRQRIANTITFNAEVQSVVVIFGFPIRTWIPLPFDLPKIEVIQHRYWANNMKYPVLEMELDSTENFGVSARYNPITPNQLFKKIDKNNIVKIYPNPAQDRLHFEQVIGNAWVEILDLKGKLIKKQHINTQQNIISVKDIPQGMYLYRIYNSENTSTGKWMKE